MGFADVAKGLISVGEGFVSLAEKVVDFAADFLHFVQDIVAAGAQVLAQILDWAADNLFKLDLLELNGKLDSEFNACIGLKIKCIIVGLRIDHSGKSHQSRLHFSYLIPRSIYSFHASYFNFLLHILVSHFIFLLQGSY